MASVDAGCNYTVHEPLGIGPSPKAATELGVDSKAYGIVGTTDLCRVAARSNSKKVAVKARVILCRGNAVFGRMELGNYPLRPLSRRR